MSNVTEFRPQGSWLFCICGRAFAPGDDDCPVCGAPKPDQQRKQYDEVIDINERRQAKENAQLQALNERMDLELAAVARARGMTVQALEQEYLDEIDEAVEADPDFQLWRLSQQPGERLIDGAEMTIDGVGNENTHLGDQL